MSHQVIWTRRVTSFFADQANLSKLQREVLETRIAGMSITEQSFYFSLSVSSINRIIARLKVKYDAVQKQFPEQLKPRRNSATETYLDTH